jgi:hypothetical protein
MSRRIFEQSIPRLPQIAHGSPLSLQDIPQKSKGNIKTLPVSISVLSLGKTTMIDVDKYFDP